MQYRQRFRFFICSLLCGCWLSGAAAESPQIELSLAEAIALGLRQNRNIENAYLERIIQKFDLRVAQDLFNPKLTLGSSLAYDSTYADASGRDHSAIYGGNAAISLQMPTGGQLALTADHSATLSQDNADQATDGVDLSLTQPLLKGAGLTVGRAELTLAERTEESNLLSLKTTLSSFITQVIKQYRAYLSAQQELEIAQLSLQRSHEQLHITQELIQSGRLPAVEEIQYETDVANQQLSLRSAENALNTARIELLALLRLPPETQIVATERLEVAALMLGLAQLQDIAFAQRSDYRQAEITVANADLQLELAKNNRLWQLDVSFRYALSRTGSDTFPPFNQLNAPQEGDYRVGLELSIPLWDLEPQRQVVAAKVLLKQSQNDLLTLKERMILDLQQAYQDLQIRWQQVSLSQRALELSRKQLDIEKTKLTVGRSSSFQLVSFQNSLVEAETQHLNAQIDYLNALTDLDEMLGTTLAHWGVELEPQPLPASLP